jgi:hypothetical protein
VLEKHIATRTGNRSDRIAASSPAFVGLLVKAEQGGLRDKWPKTKQKHALDTSTVHAKDIRGRRALAFSRVSAGDAVAPGGFHREAISGRRRCCSMWHDAQAQSMILRLARWLTEFLYTLTLDVLETDSRKEKGKK